MGRLLLVVLCAVLALPVAAAAQPGRSGIIAILITCKAPPKQPGNTKPRTCSGGGTTKLGSDKVAWKLSLQLASKAVHGTLTLGTGADAVTLIVSSNVAAGDVNGDGFSGQGAYTVQGGQGALKVRFAAAASKQLLLSGTRVATGFALRLEYTGLE